MSLFLFFFCWSVVFTVFAQEKNSNDKKWFNDSFYFISSWFSWFVEIFIIFQIRASACVDEPVQWFDVLKLCDVNIL